MEAKRKRNNVIVTVLVLALAAGMAALPRMLHREDKSTADAASILSAPVRRGDIRTTISGGGTLTDGEGTMVTAPHGVEITEYLVKNGDMVQAGQPIAMVDMVSVQTTLQTLQKNLDYLSRQMKLNPSRIGQSRIQSVNAGRVKAVYAKLGDQVIDVIREHGALAVISLDGLMAVQMDTTSAVRPAENVTVRLSDGTEKPGRVERRLGDTVTVTLTDNGPAIGEKVEVFDQSGGSVGTGELYVHSAWNVAATSGEISYVNLKEGSIANAGLTIFMLRNVEFSTDYTKYYEQHLEYEDAMQRLFEIYRDGGAITAACDGRVSGIDSAVVGPVREGGGDYVLTLLDNPEPEPDPRRDAPKKFTNRYAQIGEIKFGSITFYVQKDKYAVEQYSKAAKVDLSKCKASVVKSFAGVTIYDYDKDKKNWKEITPDELLAGDILWFVYDAEGHLRWIMRPIQPEPEVVSSGGGVYVEPPFEMFELYDTDVAKITPMETVTVEVNIDELDIVSVSEGQAAEITIDALPGRAYTGTVSRIDPNGKNTGGSTRYKVTITIDRDENMLTGMNATAILTVGVTENVLTIPTAALNQKGSRTVVYTGYDAETKTLIGEREVTIGVSDGETVAITQGLNEGETVWYSYYETTALPDLFAGAPVDVA